MPADLASMVFATTAHVSVRATSEELLTLAEQRGADRSVFETNAPFFWANEISSNRLDAYFTKMDPLTTLPNFAADAARGVAFLAGHNNRVLPFGSTLTGALENQGDITRVLADAYTLAGLDLGGVNTNSFIAGVRAGIIKDDSVGFYGGQWICDICGRDMLTDWWDCWHVPGLIYEIKDANDAQTVVREQLCTATVKNAHLAEVSAVYDGATPGAAILQAQRAAESGRLSPMQAQLIEQRYRIHLPDTRIVVPGAALPRQHRRDLTVATPAFAIGDAVVVNGTPHMDGQSAGVVAMAVTTNVYGVIFEGMEGMGIHKWYVEDELAASAAEGSMDMSRSAPQEDRMHEEDENEKETPVATEGMSEARSVPAAAPDDPFAGIRAVLGLAADVDVMAVVRDYAAQAENGKAYHEAQINDALKEGARALGSDFDEETYRGMLSNAPIITIQRMKNDWEKIASARFVGGRRTRDQAPTAPGSPAPAPVIPDAAFAG